MLSGDLFSISPNSWNYRLSTPGHKGAHLGRLLRLELLSQLERALHLDQLSLRRVRLQVVANLALVAWVMDICRGYQPQTRLSITL